MLQQQKKTEAYGHAQDQGGNEGPYQIFRNMRRRRIKQIPICRRQGILNAGGRIVIVSVRRDSGIVGIPMKDGEDAETKGAENEEKEED